jgi:hypothetical protein
MLQQMPYRLVSGAIPPYHPPDGRSFAKDLPANLPAADGHLPARNPRR